MILRDLAAQVNKLRGADRQLAASILARPTDGTSEGAAGYTGKAAKKKNRRYACTRNFCVHWVIVGSEKPSLVDKKPKNRRPDYIDKVIANMTRTWSKVTKSFGYRKPLSDKSSGLHKGGNPNAKLDIFVANIGHVGFFGYCTTDDPRRHPGRQRAASAYCVVDNDFSKKEFGSDTSGIPALQATLAHEFFHAVQLAYDFFEERALMEGTATWMEDEVFDSVNDGLRHLDVSPITASRGYVVSTGQLIGPFYPLDYFSRDYSTDWAAGWQYASWIWYRYLSENFDALLIRQIWEHAGRAHNGMPALIAALSARGTSLVSEMVTFGLWASAPATFFDEGSSYPTAGPAETQTIADGQGFDLEWEMLRRSDDYIRFTPAASLGTGSTLDFDQVSVPGTVRLTAIPFNGRTPGTPVDVTSGGSVPFAVADGVTRVILVLTNSGGSVVPSSNLTFIAVANAP